MMHLIIFGLLLASAAAQRPFYAGSRPIGVPELAARFRDPDADQPIANRLDSSRTTEKIPVDARGDEDLVKRLQQWPKENQPFWLLNAEHIERQRNPDIDKNQVSSRSWEAETRPIKPAVPRPSFAGSNGRR